MKTITRTLPLLLLMIFGLVGHVSAQTSWLPSHNAAQHVYVAPGVDSSLATQFNSADFSAQLSAGFIRSESRRLCHRHGDWLRRKQRARPVRSWSEKSGTVGQAHRASRKIARWSFC